MTIHIAITANITCLHTTLLGIYFPAYQRNHPNQRLLLSYELIGLRRQGARLKNVHLTQSILASPILIHRQFVMTSIGVNAGVSFCDSLLTMWQIVLGSLLIRQLFVNNMIFWYSMLFWVRRKRKIPIR
jgi:hypothetical protein